MVQITVKRTVNQVSLFNQALRTGRGISFIKSRKFHRKSSRRVYGFDQGDRMAAEPTFTSHMKTPGYLSLICRPEEIFEERL